MDQRPALAGTDVQRHDLHVLQLQMIELLDAKDALARRWDELSKQVTLLKQGMVAHA